MSRKTLFSIVLGVVLNCVNSVVVPVNPCPNVFQYLQNNGIVYGQLRFQNDNSGYYELTVNMSIPAYLQTTQNIRLELRSSETDLGRGYPLVYNVYFPVQEVLPKPTKIEFNHRMYCITPSEEVKPGAVLTYLWSSTFYGLPAPSRSSGRDIEIQAVDVSSPEAIASPSSPTSNSVYFANFPPELQNANSQVSLSQPSQSAASISRASFISSLQGSVPPSQLLNSVTFPNISPASQSPITSTSAPPQSLNSVFFTNALPASQSPLTVLPTSASLINSNVNQCGSSTVDIQEGLRNTNTVIDAQFPWLAAILYRDHFNYHYRCTGSLISSEHVLTAGHCIRYNNVLLSPFQDLVLVFGKINIENWVNAAVLRGVKDITVHPDYKQNKGDCDLAVITVDKPVPFEKNIKPVCLWGEERDLNKIEGTEGIVAGWSRDETGDGVIPDANKVNAPVVSQATCLRSHSGFSSITSSRTFCAGNRIEYVPCHGNTGAGFVMNRNGRWTLRGIVSAGLGEFGTCDLRSYIVFADVAKSMDWIIDIMA